MGAEEVMKHFLEEVALVLSQIRLWLCGSQGQSFYSKAEGMYRGQGLTWKGREHLREGKGREKRKRKSHRWKLRKAQKGQQRRIGDHLGGAKINPIL